MCALLILLKSPNGLGPAGSDNRDRPGRRPTAAPEEAVAYSGSGSYPRRTHSQRFYTVFAALPCSSSPSHEHLRLKTRPGPARAALRQPEFGGGHRGAGGPTLACESAVPKRSVPSPTAMLFQVVPVTRISHITKKVQDSRAAHGQTPREPLRERSGQGLQPRPPRRSKWRRIRERPASFGV